MDDKRKVFISYSSIDRVYAEKIATDLQSWGLDVWWDQWEIKVGDSLTEKIQQGLIEASWLAVVLTPDSITSSWVQRELRSALARVVEDVTILPLLFRNCDIPLFLRDVRYADFRSDYDVGFCDLLEALSPPIQAAMVEKLLSENELQVRATFSRIPVGDRGLYNDRLVAELSSPTAQRRRGALHALWVLQSEYLPVALFKGVKDPSVSVRRHAVFLMGATGSGWYKRIVAALTSDSTPMIREAARTALKKLSKIP